MSSKEQDANRAKSTAERYESQLQTEVKIRTDLENRNTALDQEITKVGCDKIFSTISFSHVNFSILKCFIYNPFSVLKLKVKEE